MPLYKDYEEACRDETDDERSDDSGGNAGLVDDEHIKMTDPDYILTQRFADEFIAFAKREMCNIIANYNKMSQNHYKLVNDELSERLTALLSLRPKTFIGLANGEFLYTLCKTFDNSILRIKSDHHKILTERIQNIDTMPWNIAKYRYEFDKTFGQTRANLIDYFFFPENLTNFLMQKYIISYKEATGKLYGTNVAENTVFFEALKQQ